MLKVTKLIPLILMSVFILLTPHSVSAQDEQIASKAAEISDTKDVPFEGVIRQIEEAWYDEQSNELHQKLTIEVVTGDEAGKYISTHVYIPLDQFNPYKKGQRVVLHSAVDNKGDTTYYVTDTVRRKPLMLLFILFVLISVLIGHKSGITSLIGMTASFIVIFKGVLPALLAGHDPILTAILAAIAIIPITFYLSHGFNNKTHIAIFSTLIVLLLTGFLAKFFINSTALTGFASEEAGFLAVIFGNQINLRGLLLAGIIIASMGILDDITISQASIVQELKTANPKLSFHDLYEKAHNVGRDHIASIINTLVLVYTGASLPLLLLFLDSDQNFSQVVNYEIIAEEIVRTLVPSIGLIAAVPVTTLIAALIFSRTHKEA